MPDATPTPHRRPRLAAAGGGAAHAGAVDAFETGAAPVISAGDAVRALLFFAVFIYFWIGFEIFTDLADPKTLLIDNDGNAFRQIVSLGLVAVVGIFALISVRDMLPVLITPFVVAMATWLLVSAVLSADPGLSGRRFVHAMLMVGLAAVFPLIADSERSFARLLAAALAAFLALNFLAVIFVPNLAIHQPWDLREANLAGGWRGAFQHKNAAGSAMATAIFLGIYLARAYNLVLGTAIALGATIFLAFTASKTPVLFLLPTFAAAWLILRMRSTYARGATLLGLLALINLFTLGTVIFPAIKSIVEKTISDPTFTNRTDIWEFATRAVADHPIKGHGFAAFWGTTDVAMGGDSMETWATKAGHAHNGYLDAVVNSGFPALVLLLIWLVVAPLRDLATIERSGPQTPLVSLYIHLLVFGLLMSCLESLFFAADGPIWFMILFAVFGLRLQATTELVRAPPLQDATALRSAAA